MIGASTLGSTSTNMIRVLLAPNDRAASMYSRSRIDRTWPRTMRATEAQLNMAITKTETARLAPMIDTSAIANSRNGKDSTTSISRDRIVSATLP